MHACAPGRVLETLPDTSNLKSEDASWTEHGSGCDDRAEETGYMIAAVRMMTLGPGVTSAIAKRVLRPAYHRALGSFFNTIACLYSGVPAQVGYGDKWLS